MKSTWSLQQEHFWAQGFLEDKALLGLAQTQSGKKDEGKGEWQGWWARQSRKAPWKKTTTVGTVRRATGAQGNRKSKVFMTVSLGLWRDQVQFLVCLFLTMVMGKWLLPKLILGFLAPGFACPSPLLKCSFLSQLSDLHSLDKLYNVWDLMKNEKAEPPFSKSIENFKDSSAEHSVKYGVLCGLAGHGVTTSYMPWSWPSPQTSFDHPNPVIRPCHISSTVPCTLIISLLLMLSGHCIELCSPMAFSLLCSGWKIEWSELQIGFQQFNLISFNLWL